MWMAEGGGGGGGGGRGKRELESERGYGGWLDGSIWFGF